MFRTGVQEQSPDRADLGLYVTAPPFPSLRFIFSLSSFSLYSLSFILFLCIFRSFLVLHFLVHPVQTVLYVMLTRSIRRQFINAIRLL